MTTSVLVPWRPGCPDRDAAWAWVRDRYATELPEWQLVVGTHDDGGPFSRTQAILAAAARADGDRLVVTDADVWCDGIAAAVDQLEPASWVVPHRLLHRLSRAATAAVLAGADWRGQPLSDDDPQDRRPYVGFEAGTLLVLPRDVLHECPPDPRFVGWGHEEQAWAIALRTLVGRPRRGTADLVHLWHPPQPRPKRTQGSGENLALLRRYARAAGRPDAVRALIEEVTPWPIPSTTS